MPFVRLALWVAGLGAVGLLPAAVELRLIGVVELARTLHAPLHATQTPVVLLASRTPPSFTEGNQTFAAEVPSMKRGARQGGVCRLGFGCEADGLDGDVSLTPARLGGLSGLDYDAVADRWLAVSDDKSEHGPARAYALKIDYDQGGASAAAAEEVVPLRHPDGSTYPPEAAPDFESLRIDPRDGSLWYASEGSKERGLPPFVRHAGRAGDYLADLPHPPLFAYLPDRGLGLRRNLAFEGLAFAPDGNSLWLAAEGPLKQDGPVPTTTGGALTRLTRLGRDGTMLAQYAYPLSPVPLAPAPGKLADNGVSEILALADDRLLVLERSGRQDEAGVWHFTARIFEADFSGATEISDRPALAGDGICPVAKHLVFDFATAGLPPVDNLEGIAWGRKLPNGHETLVLVSDDNFNAHQTTQLWVFEILSAFNPIQP
jgi:hypothetical protein